MKTINQTGPGNNPPKSPWKKIIRILLLLLLVFSLFFYRDSFHEIWEGIRQVTAKELLAGILLATAGYLLEGLTIFCMMGAVSPHASLRESIFIAFVCEFYRLTTLGNGSGMAEIHYLCQYGAKKADPPSSGKESGRQEAAPEGIGPGSATVLTMIQYVAKRTAIMALGLCGFLILSRKTAARTLCREYAAFVGIGCLLTTGILLIFLSLSLSARVADTALLLTDRLIRRFPGRAESLLRWKEQIRLLNHSGKKILRQKGRMLCVVLIQSGKLLLFYQITAYFLRGKAVFGMGGCILLMALAFMLSGVIPAPSGAGALEFVFLLFFTPFTQGKTAAVAILLFRFATWIFPAAAGGILLAVRRVKERPGRSPV